MTPSPPTNTSGSEDRGGHTKGPWKIDFGHPRGLPGGISAQYGGRPVTRFNAFARPSTPEALANARLIAAAPELLEALIEMEREKSDYMTRNKLGDPAKEHTNKMARAAIAKAAGS